MKGDGVAWRDNLRPVKLVPIKENVSNQSPSIVLRHKHMTSKVDDAIGQGQSG